MLIKVIEKCLGNLEALVSYSNVQVATGFSLVISTVCSSTPQKYPSTSTGV